MALDDERVKTKTELIKSEAYERTKQHIVFDNVNRPILIFTAVEDTKNGEPCSVTEYVYRNGTSTDVRTRQERVSKWNTVWEDDFIFDPTVSYDTDGDGIL